MSTLLKKLNRKEESKLHLLNLPNDLSDLFTEEDILLVRDQMDSNMDFILIFCENSDILNKHIDPIGTKLHEKCKLWVAYPKKSSQKYKSDLTRDTLWDVFGSYDMEPVRQVAIDEDWSAIRYRHVSQIKSMTRSRAATKAGQEKIKNNRK